MVGGVEEGQGEEAGKGEEEGEEDVEGAFAEVIGRMGDEEEDDEAGGVGGDGPEVGFDGAVAEAGDDLFGGGC